MIILVCIILACTIEEVNITYCKSSEDMTITKLCIVTYKALFHLIFIFVFNIIVL